MILGLNSPNEAPYEAGKDFSVVIACEDSSTAPSACEVLELVEQNLNHEGRLFYQWWNFEVLAIPSLRELAAVETATADMIVVDLHEGRELPGIVTDWMKQWLAIRNQRPGALLAVVDSDRKKPDVSQGILSELKQAAALGHMDFFVSRAKELRKDAGMTRRVKEAVWQIRHGAQTRCAKRTAGRRQETGGAKKNSTRSDCHL